MLHRHCVHVQSSDKYQEQACKPASLLKACVQIDNCHALVLAKALLELVSLGVLHDQVCVYPYAGDAYILVTE